MVWYDMHKNDLSCTGIVQFRIRILIEAGDSSGRKKRQANTNNDIIENVSCLLSMPCLVKIQ